MKFPFVMDTAIRTPLRSQFQSTECGIAVLRIVFAHYGCDVTAHELRASTGVGRDCLHAGDLRRAAEAHGFACTVRSLEAEQLRNQELPLIVHLRFIHFAVLERVGRRSVRLNCPLTGRIEISSEEFARDFTGVVLTLRPRAETRQRSLLMCSRENAWWLDLCKNAMPSVLAGAALTAVRSFLILGLATKITRAASTLSSEALFASAIAGSWFASNWLQQQRARRRNDADCDRLLTALESVDSSFYVYRQTSALLWLPKRLRALHTCIADRIIPALLATLELFILGVGALWLSGARGVVLAAITTAWGAAVAMLSLWARAAETANSGEGQSAMVSSVNALLHPERARFGRRAEDLSLDLHGALAHASAARVSGEGTAWLLAQMPAVLALMMVGWVVVSPKPSASALMFVAIAMAWAARPLVRLRGVGEFLRGLAQPILDVFQEPTAPTNCVPESKPLDGDGLLCARNLCFSHTCKPLLRDVTFALYKGEQVLLTGAPGSGKTALTEVLTGLQRPQSGSLELAVDRSIVRVGQKHTLFEATLRENILLWNDGITDLVLHDAVRDAQLADLVGELPGGLDFQVEADGRNLSGGQRQRIEIARALALRRDLLVLDDALSALDPLTARHLLDALRERGCTVLVVMPSKPSSLIFDRELYLQDGTLREEGSGQVTDEDLSRDAERSTTFGTLVSEVETSDSEIVTPEQYEAVSATVRLLTGATGTARWQAGLTRTMAIRNLARSTEYLARPIRFLRDEWWVNDFGEALLFRRDGTPLLARQEGLRTILVDPVSGTEQRLMPCDARGLSTDAFQFVLKNAPSPMNVGTWRRLLYKATLPEMTMLVTAALLASVSFLLAAAFVLRGKALPAALVLLGGAGCSLIALHQLTRRAITDAARQHTDALVSLLAQVDPKALLLWPARRIILSAQSVFEVCGQVNMPLKFLPLSFALLLVSLGALAVMQHGDEAVREVLCIVACGACAAVGARLRASRVLELREAAQRSTERLHRVFSGANNLRAMGHYEALLRRWQIDAQDIQKREQQSELVGTASMSGVFAVLLLGAAAVLHTSTAARTVASGLFCVALLVALDCNDVAAWLIHGRGGVSVAERLFGSPRETGTTPVRFPGTLSAAGITIRYPHARNVVFTGASVAIRSGELTVLQGPSGGGKSTLLRVLLGLQAPQDGAVLWEDVLLADLDLQRWRSRITFLSQDDPLEDCATIRTHLGGRSISPAVLWQALEAVELANAVRAMPMGLQTIVAEDTISSGEVQRLRLAAAFVDGPSLLVVDEATSAIPEEMERRIFVRLRERGVTCLVATHRSGLRSVADAVYSVDAASVRAVALEESRGVAMEEAYV